MSRRHARQQDADYPHLGIVNKLTPRLEWAAEPPRPRWLDNYAVMHGFVIQWSGVESHWTVLSQLPSAASGSFYVLKVHSGMSLEDFTTMVEQDPPQE